MNQVIKTHHAPGLWITLRGMAVVAWALTADYGHGLRVATGALWRGYRQQRAELAAFERANPVSAWPTDDELAEQMRGGVLEDMGREFGRPGWLSATVLALVISLALVDIVDGWATLQAMLAGLAEQWRWVLVVLAGLAAGVYRLWRR